MLIKPAAEVAGRCRIRDPTGSESIELALVVPQNLQVLQPCPAHQQVVGDVQHVVRLVVRQVDLQQMKTVIDRPIQAQVFDQQVHRADPARTNRLGSSIVLVGDVLRCKFRPRRRRPFRFLQPPGDSLLACFQLPTYFGYHSKLLLEWRVA